MRISFAWENAEVPLTPRIRDFLVELEELIARSDSPGLDHDRTTINTAHAVALVRLHHRTGTERTGTERTGTERTGAEHDVELQVDDHNVIVSYGGEPVHLRDRAFALQFVEALLTGRVDIEVHRGLLWRTTSSYLDRSPRPFLVTRMPVPTFVAPAGRTERRSVGFGPA
jgi:hypothetical protein